MNRILESVAIIPLLLLIFSGALSAEDTSNDPASNYRMLQWEELIPAGWEPPLVPEAHNKVETSPDIDPQAIVAELDQQLVSLPGYLRPVVFEGNLVKEFLLVPYLPHHIKQHAHLESNQMVYVSLLEPTPIEAPFSPFWVVGTMTLQPKFTDEGLAAYSIGDALITEYEY